MAKLKTILAAARSFLRIPERTLDAGEFGTKKFYRKSTCRATRGPLSKRPELQYLVVSVPGESMELKTLVRELKAAAHGARRLA